jgi:Family of unknown function (DUF6498)
MQIGTPGARLNASILLALIGNLIPLAGLFYWNWDPFQLLMLYWMETLVVAGWALARIGTLPENLLGRMTVNGRDQPATHAALLWMFGTLAAAFCFAHFLFLWFIFQDGWRGRVDGPTRFVRVFVIESGAWVPLLFAFLAGAVAFLTSPTRPQIVRLAEAHVLRNNIVEQSPRLDEATHGVGAAVGGLLGRIVIMQVAVIFGAMLSRSYGSNAPMYIVIGLKLLSDLGGKPLGGGSVKMQSKFGGKSTTQTVKRPDETPRT